MQYLLNRVIQKCNPDKSHIQTNNPNNNISAVRKKERHPMEQAENNQDTAETEYKYAKKCSETTYKTSQGMNECTWFK